MERFPENKIVFLTFHNWQTKRQGGFHKFAEVFAEKGYLTYFISLPRPYYSFFKSLDSDERINRMVLKTLTKGIQYKVGKGIIYNVTLPTLALPGKIRKIVGEKIDFFFQKTSLKSTRKFFEKHGNGASHFVFESNECIIYYDLIKKMFPKSKIIYRPSDPLFINKGINSKFVDLELRILKEANHVFLVNQQSFDAYNAHVDGFMDYKNIEIIYNGVSLDSFQKVYVKPEILKISNTALYVGARDADWNLIVEAAKLDKTINYIIICPEEPNEAFISYSKQIGTNLYYLPGIFPNEVPEYLTNSDVVIIPNPRDRYKLKNWGLTAKYMQAMVAKKPIVSYHDNIELSKYGFPVVYDAESFVSAINIALSNKEVSYDFDFNSRNWDYLKEVFYNKLILDV